MGTRNLSLTDGPITKSLIYFSAPILISNLFQQLYNSIDSAVVGTYAGKLALAAVGSTGSLINLLIGFFLGMATGTGILYAMHFGAEDYKGLKKLISSALIISVIAGAFLTVVGVTFARQMLVLMDTPPDVIGLSEQYLKIYMSGTIATIVYNVAAGMIRAEGDSTRPLIYLVIGGVANLILDLVFVALLDMGVAGAALATVIAQVISAVLCVIRLAKLNEEYRFRPRELGLDRLTVWDIIRISIPCGLQGSMFSIANILVQAKINSFGSIAMAGVAAYSKIDGFLYMPMMALGLAVSTYVGQNIGAGKYSRLKKGIKVCLIMSVIISLLLAVTVLLGGRHVIGLFTDDADAVQFSLEMMWYLAPFAWLFSFSDIFGGAIRGAGATVKVTIISALCICVFRVVWLIVMLRFINDIRIVFVCYPISWILSSIVMTTYYFKGASVRKAMHLSKT